MGLPDISSELSNTVEQTLKEQARRNELTIAKVRAIATGLAALVDIALYIRPPATYFAGSNVVLAMIWFALAIAIGAWLGRPRAHVPVAWLLLPVVDAGIVLSLFGNIIRTAPSEAALQGPLVNATAACTLLAITGSLRLHRSAAWMTTLAAALAFVAIAGMASLPAVEVVFTCALLSGAGFLGMWMTDVVRRAVASEVGRTVLARFLPREVVEVAHETPMALLQPRSIDVTVLISDLRGFTAMAEKLEPRKVLELLNSVHGRMSEIIELHGGIVDKFLGDGMLCVFGIHGVNTSHADAAIAAAREMAAAAPTGVQLGMGIHSGEVVTGCLGTGNRLEFTVIGDTVNTASRLEPMTKEFGVTILVSQETVLRATHATDLHCLGTVAIRGRQEQLSVYTPRLHETDLPSG